MTELLIILKATIVLLLALGAVTSAGRWRASRRHIVLFMAFSALLILPLTALLLPAIRLEVSVPRAAPASVAPKSSPGIQDSREIVSVNRIVSSGERKIDGGLVLAVIWAIPALALLMK